MEKPSELALLPQDRILKLSDIVDSAKNNYAVSFENSSKLIKLQDWINDQIEIFNKK